VLLTVLPQKNVNKRTNPSTTIAVFDLTTALNDLLDISQSSPSPLIATGTSPRSLDPKSVQSSSPLVNLIISLHAGINSKWQARRHQCCIHPLLYSYSTSDQLKASPESNHAMQMSRTDPMSMLPKQTSSFWQKVQCEKDGNRFLPSLLAKCFSNSVS
jgi:hypothetical protein